MNLDHNYPKRRSPQHEHNYAKCVDMDIPNLTDDVGDDECAAMKVSESVNREGAYGGDSNSVEGRASPEGGGGEDGNPDDERGGDRSGGGGRMNMELLSRMVKKRLLISVLTTRG